MVGTEVLREFKLFAELDDLELERIAGIAKIEHRDKGFRVTRDGAMATHLYLLREGRVAVTMTAPNGEDVQIDVIVPGELLGWSAITGPYTYTASAVALESSSVVALNANNLRHLLESDKAIGYSVLRAVASAVARRLHGLQTQFAAMKTGV